MSRVVVAGIVENSPEAGNEALSKGKELIASAQTEQGRIHYLWTADLNHPRRGVMHDERESGPDKDRTMDSGPAIKARIPDTRNLFRDWERP